MWLYCVFSWSDRLQNTDIPNPVKRIQRKAAYITFWRMKMWLNPLKCAHFAVHVIIIEKGCCSYGCSLQCQCDHYRVWHFQTDFQSAVTVAFGENKHCKLCSRSRLKRLLVCLFQGALSLLSLVQEHRIQLLKQCDMKFFHSRFFYVSCFKVWASGFW